MIPELSIIKLICNYEQWCTVQNILNVSDFPKELQGIVRTLNNQHETGGADVTVSDLANLYFSTRPKDPEFYHEIFKQLLEHDSSPNTTFKLIESIQRAKLLRELSLDAYEVAEGRGDLAKVLSKLEALNATGNKPNEDGDSEYEFVTSDLKTLVAKAISTTGLRWRLQTLNRMMGSLRKGNFGFVFARPEAGKTTFLASEVTFMAPQATTPILWFNNEQEGEVVMLRCYQAALNLDMATILQDQDRYDKEYREVTNDNICIWDEASISKTKVEKMCRTVKPSLIIFDQLDKITGFDNDREDLRLGAIYQWARELAKEYAPVIGVCQADGSGEGQKWLTMANVSSAKTSKQAEADWILGVGKQNEIGYDQIRYLHLSKNKLLGDTDTDHNLRHGRMECIMDQERGRYIDI